MHGQPDRLLEAKGRLPERRHLQTAAAIVLDVVQPVDAGFDQLPLLPFDIGGSED